MIVIEQLLQQLTRFFAETNRRWALMGGLAVSVRSRPRFSSDLDVVVAVETDQDAESLVYALMM